ncbi:MAG: glycosyltransferase [Planctomycetes bacterium]|nr:glycosyltransferase [Planctomycetota bacterium]
MTPAVVRRRSTAARGDGPATVLFVEKTIGFGGSTVGLAQIVRRLDRSRFRPLVVVGQPIVRDFVRSAVGGDVEIAVVAAPAARLPAPVHGGPIARTIRRSLNSACGAFDGWSRDLPWARAVYALAHERHVALFHLNNSVSVNQAGIAVARRLGVPCVVKQRGFEWRSLGVRRLMDHVDWFIPDSAAIAADLVALGAPRDRMRVTYCAVDADALRQVGDPRRLRAELGIPDGAPSFGIVGQLLAWKGQDVFLRAAAIVLRRFPDARAVVVGGTPDGLASRYADSLRVLAAELGIADRVVFTGHRKDVPQVLRALDVVVHASVSPEPFGTIVAEALACGRPVVAADAGGPPEYVEHGRTGLLATPGDYEAVAQAIVRQIQDPAGAAAMAEVGRRVVLSRFSVDRHVALTEGVYARLLETAVHR